jgi:hypothetical protein
MLIYNIAIQYCNILFVLFGQQPATMDAVSATIVASGQAGFNNAQR